MAPSTPDADAPIELKVREDEARQRLDRMIADRETGHSRSTIQRWINEGRVRIDGELATRKSRTRAGDEIVIEPAQPPPSDAIPQDLPLEILYEDAHLIVLNKAAGMVVHPGAGHPDGTLVNALVYHAGLEGVGDAARPGIVHRLDKDTSGVMVVAKSPAAHERLVEMFSEHALERRYLSIVVGAPPQDTTYDTLHGRHPMHRKRFSSKVEQGRRAITHMRVLERLQGATLVECRLETGRTHQIRVHLADATTPVLGDALYGGSVTDKRVRDAGQTLGRQALHATLLAFEHPITGEAMRFEMPPPEDFLEAEASLRG